ncbi:MAG: ligase-associated DNA damage response exonuclease [Phycisphaerales bacterium]
MPDLVVPTDRGLYCPPGGFHIDPWSPVDRAVVTHAHADHARPGSKRYLVSREGEGVARTRLGEDARLESLGWAEPTTINGVRISLHPAGHILGSAQVRLEHEGDVWVVTGDYKTVPDDTCTPFEPVRCRVIITECTFGLPVFRWKPQAEVFDDINAWWRANQNAGRTSVILAYSLGKAQRVMAGVDRTIGPILAHGAAMPLTERYREAGVGLPLVEHATVAASKPNRGRALVIAPPSAAGTPWMRRFGPTSDAIVSGWAQIRGTRRRSSVDRGFVLSDHADWPGLLDAIDASGAERVIATHGYTEPFARYLREAKGLETGVLHTRFVGERAANDDDDQAEDAA